MRNLWLAIAAMLLATPLAAQRNAPADAPFILEHSYWIQPGETDHFLELFARNKLPLMKKEITAGRVLWMRITRPRLRSGDPAQPDVRLTIAWRSAAVAFDDVDPSRFAPVLYKDPVLRQREEQERDRLIVHRSDIPVQETLINRE